MTAITLSKAALLSLASYLYLDQVQNQNVEDQERSWSLISQVAIGSVVGLCLAQMTFFLENVFFGIVFGAPPVGGVIFPVLVAVVLPIMEELTFRGYLDLQLQGYSVVPRIVAVAGLFALAHYRKGRLGAFCLTQAFISGLALGGVREMVGLPASITSHSVHNILVS